MLSISINDFLFVYDCLFQAALYPRKSKGIGIELSFHKIILKIQFVEKLKFFGKKESQREQSGGPTIMS